MTEKMPALETDREKLYVFSLVTLALFVSIVVEWGIVYRNYRFSALTHWVFYQSIFEHLMLLAIIPYFVAYGSGRLLALIGFILRLDKTYKPQYFTAWITLIVFSYFTGMMAVNKHNNLAMVVDECMKATQKNNTLSETKGTSLETKCANTVIPIFPALVNCVNLKEPTKRDRCIKMLSYAAGFSVEKDAPGLMQMK